MVILSNTYPGGFKDSVPSDAILEQESGRTTLKEEIQVGGGSQPSPGMDPNSFGKKKGKWNFL